MAKVPIRLYGIPMSHPVVAVRGMLDRKGLEYRYVELLAGAHPPSLWALGFRGITVPAIRFADGRRAQGSLAIAAALEEVAPSPSLYPSEPAARAAAQAAEGWGEAVLQPVPRRLIRWGLRASLRQRQWFADVATPLPAPAGTGWLLTPLTPVFVKLVGADDDGVRRDLATLPGLLDEVDRLLGSGVIGGAELGAPTSRSRRRCACCWRWRTRVGSWPAVRPRRSPAARCRITRRSRRCYRPSGFPATLR
jgi:glutathione S-transferase